MCIRDSIYRPREDERLSWPCWLSYSGRFTHINGYPSAAGLVQTSESSPITDRRSTAEPPNQLGLDSVYCRVQCTDVYVMEADCELAAGHSVECITPTGHSINNNNNNNTTIYKAP